MKRSDRFIRISKIALFLFLLFIPCFGESVDSVEKVPLQEKLDRYVKGLTGSDFSTFFLFNGEYLREEKKIKLDFPTFMWEKEILPIKKKWKKKLEDSIGTFKTGQLWDYFYEPDSGVRAKVLEVRQKQQKAFIKIEYPDQGTAPGKTKKDRRGIKELIVEIVLQDGEVDNSENLRVVNNTRVYHFFPVPRQLEINIIQKIKRVINSSYKEVYIDNDLDRINIALNLLDNVRDTSYKKIYKNILRKHGFKYIYRDEKGMGIDPKSGKMVKKTFNRLGYVPPVSWKKYIIEKKNSGLGFYSLADKRKNNSTCYSLSQTFSIDIQGVIMKDQKTAQVTFVSRCIDCNPIYPFICELRKRMEDAVHFLWENSRVKRIYSFDKGEYAPYLNNDRAYTVLFKYKKKYGWSIKGGFKKVSTKN
jgi:hypothetical protein